MKKIYLASILLLGLKASAQLNYQAVNAVNTTTAFNNISATGTAITTANTDDANSAPINIGFSFNYNGQAFTEFIFNTNGFIKLGSTAPASAAIFGAAGQDGGGGVLHGGTSPNSIAVFNHDLTGTPGTQYRVQTTGLVGTRVTTIQWSGVTEKTTTPAQQYSSMDFQIRLYEGSNIIELVYANFVANPTSADAFKVANVGLIGTNNTSTNLIYVNKGSTGAWSTATFANTPTSATQSFNFRKTVPADNGRTFRFTPTLANDLTVFRVEGLGKVPVGYGGPQIIRANIRNIGSNAVTTFTATLTITGANTFTDTKVINANVPAGSAGTISFDPVTFTNTGINNVNVTITTADDNQANNTSSFTQEVTPSVFSYANSSVPVTSSVGYNTGAGLILTKYGVSGTGYVNAVNVFIGNGATNLGNSVFGVVLSKAGAIIGQSAPLTISTADTGRLVRFNITAPPSITNDTIFVGLAQTANATGYFPVGMQNEGLPTRTGAYYTAPLAGGVPTENTTLGRFWTEAVVDGYLPLDFLTFTGVMVDKNVQLNWTTANEVNTSHFEVERSANGREFDAIGKVVSTGANSNLRHSYSFDDATASNVTADQLYYRLKQVDKDGRYKYSSVIAVKKNAGTFEVVVVNPTKDRALLQVKTNRAETIEIQLFNLSGQRIAIQNTQLSAGTNAISIGENLSKGTYILSVVTGDQKLTKQIIVQ